MISSIMDRFNFVNILQFDFEVNFFLLSIQRMTRLITSMSTESPLPTTQLYTLFPPLFIQTRIFKTSLDATMSTLGQLFITYTPTAHI